MSSNTAAPTIAFRGRTPDRRSRKRLDKLAGLLLGGLVSLPVGSAAAEKFEKLAVSLEQTVQDQDAEVKFEVIGGATGLVAVEIAAPDGRTVIDFKAMNSKLGQRHLTIESPEPRNDGRLQADFPEGIYKFTARTAAGETLLGEARLTHKFPPAVTLGRPRADESNVSINGLRITWAAVKDVQAITVVIEDEETGREVRATLAGTVTSFAVPDGFLAGSTSYKLAVGAVARSGNKSVSEISFTTAARK